MALIRQGLGHRLSTLNDTPEKACKPFAADRSGMVTSEGGGLVILEELGHAKARGARIYGELVGFGAGHDAWHSAQPSEPEPSGRGLQVAMRKALRDAGVSPEQIDMVQSFGCGLKVHDRAEATALRTVLGSRLDVAPVMNIKAAMGNNGAGAGAIDFIAAVLAMHYGTVPPAPNSTPMDPACNLKMFTDGPRDARIGYALSVAYALGGGQNAALVVKRFRD
jgi:3-oxoacyl-(acyl-carrier-protein) synthase